MGLKKIPKASKILFLIIIFLLCSRVMVETPVQDYIFGLNLILSILAIPYLLYDVITNPNKTVLRKGVNPYKIIIILLIIPFWVGISSYLEFGQPVYLGIFTERDFFLIIYAWIILRLLEKNIITIELIKNAFLINTWICFFVFMYFFLFVNSFQFLGTNFVAFNDVKGSAPFYRFKMFFIIGGIIFYAIRFADTTKLKYLFYTLLLFICLYYRDDRTYLLFTMIGMVFSFTDNSRKKRFIYISFFSFLGLIIFIISLYSNLFETFFSFLGTTISSFSNDNTNDISIAIRVQEALIAFKYFSNNPILGNGELSNHFKEGYATLGYFFPSDVGILGLLYVLGIGGVIVLFYQFYAAKIFSRRASMNDDSTKNSFLKFCKYYLVVLFLDGLTNGSTLFFAFNTIIIVTLLYFCTRQISPKSPESLIRSV